MMTKEAQKLNDRLMEAWARGGPDAVIKAAVFYCDEMDAALKAEKELCDALADALVGPECVGHSPADTTNCLSCKAIMRHAEARRKDR